MQKILTIAMKEFHDALKNKLFLMLLIILLVLIGVSIIVTSFDFQNKVMEYNKSVQILKNLGKSIDKIPAPRFFPLQMLRAVMEYLEFIGAIIGIILGYLSIAKEKGKNTLQLLLTRPIGRFDIVSGKVLGNSILVLLVLAAAFVTVCFVMWVIGGVILSTTEIMKLGIVLLLSFIYIMGFFCITSILALVNHSLPNALIFSIIIWLLFVLIIPQIGDTMDPDNQIPGGFFKSMNISKPQEKEILAKFNTYETIRNNIEESSIMKQYERFVFALLGIKDEYNNKEIGFILMDKRGDGVWIMVFFLVSLGLEYFILVRNNLLLHRV